jgi:nucleotide-binding universal stress UspA family protein
MRPAIITAQITRTMNTLVAPLDFSPVSDAVIATIRELAAAMNAHVVLLHVVPPPVIMTAYGMATTDMPHYLTSENEKARQKLGQYHETLAAAGIPAREIVVQGPAVEAILTVAEEQKADMLVMGSHGHGGLYEFLVGSTTRGILRSSPVPVVLVPSHKVTEKAEQLRKKRATAPVA